MCSVEASLRLAFLLTDTAMTFFSSSGHAKAVRIIEGGRRSPTPRLVAAREKAADACPCQDVPSHPSADQRLKEGFGAGREIRERGQRHRSIERINREHVLVHRRIQLRRRARAVVLEVGAAKSLWA